MQKEFFLKGMIEFPVSHIKYFKKNIEKIKEATLEPTNEEAKTSYFVVVSIIVTNPQGLICIGYDVNGSLDYSV